jgi:hypothetical protein
VSPSEVARLLGEIGKRWPFAPLPSGSADVWLDDLAGVSVEQATAAVRKWAKAGEKFPPTSGWVFSETVRAGQDAPPPFEAVGESLMRYQHWLPWDPEGRFTPEEEAAAIRVLAERGVHEAVLRFIQAEGLGQCYRIRWGERGSLDIGAAADLRDRARRFSELVAAWRQDPTPGLALGRAERALSPVSKPRLIGGAL